MNKISFEQFWEGLNDTEKGIIAYYREWLPKIDPQLILEVGSGWGLFSRSAMEFTTGRVVTLDKIGGYGLDRFMKHTAGFEDRIERIVEDSHHLLPANEEKWREKFDFIFVDADHTQDGAAKDISFSWPMLKPGGWFMVDDVFHKLNWDPDPGNPSGFNFGVTKALWGFISAHGSEFESPAQILPIGHGIVIVQKKK